MNTFKKALVSKLMLLLLLFTGQSAIAQTTATGDITTNDVVMNAGEKATVEVKLVSSEPVINPQFDITLPEGVKIVEGSLKRGDLLSRQHTPDYAEQTTQTTGNTYRFIVTSLNVALNATEGTLLTFDVTDIEDSQVKYPIVGEIEVKNKEMILDADHSVVLNPGRTTSSIRVNVAFDGTVAVSVTPTAFDVDYDKPFSVDFDMENTGAVVNVQATLTLPAGVELVKTADGNIGYTDRIPGNVSINAVDNPKVPNQYTIIMTNLSATPIIGNGGTLFTINMEAGEALPRKSAVKITGIVVATQNGGGKHLEDEFTITLSNNHLGDLLAELQAAIAEAEAIDLTPYSEESVKVLTDAIAASKELLTADAASKVTLTAAIKALATATEGLTVVETVGTYTLSVLPTTITGEKTAATTDIQVTVKKAGEKYWLESEADVFKGLKIPFTYNEETKVATFSLTFVATTEDAAFVDCPNLYAAAFVFNAEYGLTEPQPSYPVAFDVETGFEFAEGAGLAWFACDDEGTPYNVYSAFYVVVPGSGDEEPSLTPGDYSVTYAVQDGETHKAGETVKVNAEDITVATLTFGFEGGKDFAAPKKDDKRIEGFWGYTEGNTENGTATSGTVYTINPKYDGQIEVGVVLNADKKFYVLEDGVSLADYDGITVGEKYYGTYKFDVVGGKEYKVYCGGSKLGFYGFNYKFTVSSEGAVYGDATIEGEWKFAINDHYAGAESRGQVTDTYTATLDGNTVTFMDEWEESPIVAEFTAENTLTFKKVAVGVPATYTLTQSPFTDGSKVTDLSTNPEDFVFESFTATYDPEAGTLTFPEGAGLLYGSANAAGEFSSYAMAFDLVSAKKAGVEEPAPLEATDLTADMFKHYESHEATEGTPIGCAYELNVSTGLPYGDGMVDMKNFADLSQYKLLVVTVSEGTPRFCFNRMTAEGQDNDDESLSELLDIPGKAWGTEKYQTVDGNVYTINLEKIVADKGFAHLHCIKGANWQNVTVTSMVLYKEKTEEPVSTTRRWDFTNWSAKTVANLKADAAQGVTEGWSDVEKNGDTEPTETSKDNCFWSVNTPDEIGGLSANKVLIDELKGLKFGANVNNRGLAIAVNYPVALSTYEGPSYLWLGGANKQFFTIPAVKAGSTIKMGVESHKTTDARGVDLLVNGTSIGKFTPTTYAENTWTVTAEEAVDIVVDNTNGCHIYYIEVEQDQDALLALAKTDLATVITAVESIEDFDNYSKESVAALAAALAAASNMADNATVAEITEATYALLNARAALTEAPAITEPEVTLVHTASSFSEGTANVFKSTVDAEYEHVNNTKGDATWAGYAYAEFAVAIPAGKPYTATLTFTGRGESRNARNCDVLYVNAGETLDYEALAAGDAKVDLAATAISSVTFPKGADATEDFTVDVTAAVKAIVAEGQDYIIFKFTGNPGGGDVLGKASEKAPQLTVVMQDEEPVVDPLEVTAELFYTWDGFGADAKAIEPVAVESHYGEAIGAGAMVLGTSTVDYLIYADLTGRTGLLIEGTPGTELRILMNRQESNNGPLVEKNVTIGEDGTAELSLTDLEYVHLNSIKTSWGMASMGSVTKINAYIDMPVRLAYKVNEVVDGKVVRTTTGKAEEGATIKVPYRKYNVLDGKLYQKGATNKEFNYTFTLTTDGQEENLEYSATDVENVVFFSEGEDIKTLTLCEGAEAANSAIRSSNSAAAYAAEDAAIVTLGAGTYVLNAIIFDASKTPDSHWVFKAGETEIADLHCTTVNLQELQSEKFVLTEETTIIMAQAGSNKMGLDAIYIVKTDDATGINTVNAETENGAVYNLQGQKVLKAQKGLYIINGKKVLVK